MSLQGMEVSNRARNGCEAVACVLEKGRGKELEESGREEWEDVVEKSGRENWMWE